MKITIMINGWLTSDRHNVHFKVTDHSERYSMK